MLTAYEWREELRERRTRAFNIAAESEKVYGVNHHNTQKAYRLYDHLTAVAIIEGA